VVLAGATAASATGIAAARAQRLEIPQSNLEMGRIIEPTAYGMPSKFEAHVSRRRTDVLVNKQNWSDWSMTPLQHQLGIVTPNGLFFERHHAGVPDIDPDKHQLVIHGMVKQPLKFSMSDLMRYPSVSKIVFLECSGNGLTDWTKAASTTVQQSHGLLSCARNGLAYRCQRCSTRRAAILPRSGCCSKARTAPLMPAPSRSKR
jgi:sulfane dehydrogenase subunit SoxC